MILQTLENTVNERMKTYKKGESENQKGLLKRWVNVDEVWGERMASVKLIYNKIQASE
jgi:hypothetical protein